MKTTTIGRIGAIVTGAAMLGTAVASALAGAVTVDSGLSKGFFFDSSMNPKVQLVVGEKAAASDGAAAGQIAAMIGNMAFRTTTVTKEGQTVTVPGGTATCTPSAAECAAVTGSAEGKVVLSWKAIGMVGELQQKEMNCSIYEDTMLMDSLDDGGDQGTFCDNDDWEGAEGELNEVFGPTDTLGTTMVGICQTSLGQDVSILRTEEFANEITTICYNYCDIALGCDPHLMSEWVVINCDELELLFDCDEEALVLEVNNDALEYGIFTDDILTADILDEDGDLVGQSYMGKVLLGQHEYYVEDIDDDSITIACGATGTATTSAPMVYTAPLEGSDCDAGDSDQEYAIKLVGAQTLEEVGVVDVTLEVTKPDGTTEQVTSGISGTPIVGDLKVKLQRGTAASNVITGEQSFSADMIVWYVPSEYTFEDGERYTEQGVENDDGIWYLEFNNGADITVSEVKDLEENEELWSGIELPDDLEENDQWSDCYEDASDDDQSTKVVRFMEFNLRNEDNFTDLPAGKMIQLPFNDGMYLLSDLKFGYMGLMNEDFMTEDLVDKTTVNIELDSIEFENDTYEDEIERFRRVAVDYTDEYGDSINDARLDEGPFGEGDTIIICGDSNTQVIKIRSIDYNDTDEDDVVIEFDIKEGSEWKSYKDEDALQFLYGSTYTSDLGDYDILSAVQTVEDQAFGSGYMVNANGNSEADLGSGDWYLRDQVDLDSPSKWELWIDKNGDSIFAMAETCNFCNPARDPMLALCECNPDNTVNTELDGIGFCAELTTVLLEGAEGSGLEDSIALNLLEDNESQYIVSPHIANFWNSEVFVEYNNGCPGNGSCELKRQCEDIATGEEDGTLISLSGAVIEVDGSEVEEPEDSGNEEDIVTGLRVTIPEDEMRPTIFFGLQSALNTTTKTITKSMEGQVVNIGGVDVTVEEFGVTASVSGGGIVGGQPTQVTCSSVQASCPALTAESSVPVAIGYKLVVVEGAQDGSKNLILVGGPSVNSLTKDLTTSSDLCKGAVVKLVASNKLLVAGCEAADTMAAANDLAAWIKANV